MALELFRRKTAILAGIVLTAYWIAMLVGTHLPPDHVIMRSITVWDKLLHFSAFAGLVVLISVNNVVWRMNGKQANTVDSSRSFLARFFDQHLPLLNYLVIWVVAVAYGSLDEPTQTPFRRTCDPLDLLADTIGATSGLFCVWFSLQIGSRMVSQDDVTRPKQSS